jgi:hypothetical protein
MQRKYSSLKVSEMYLRSFINSLIIKPWFTSSHRSVVALPLFSRWMATPMYGQFGSNFAEFTDLNQHHYKAGPPYKYLVCVWT